MAKVIKLDKFADELKRYQKKNIDNYRKSVADALMKALVRLVKKSPVDTGLFAQSWHLEIDEKKAIIGNSAPHGAIIEFGARPFTPPIKPLLEWAKRVLKKPEIDDHCWALARYTQNKISEYGMEPKHILTNDIDNIMDDIRNNLKKGVNP